MPSERLTPPTHDDLAVLSTDGRADRRAFLKKAGIVGAGVAGATWAAPSILALDKAFAAPGSCCAQNSLNLAASPFGDTTDLTVGSFTSLGTTMTFTRTRADTITNTTCTNGNSWTTAVVSTCEQGGVTTGQIPITAHGNNNTANAVTITFNPAVRNLSFLLVDIDASTNALVQYQEEVTVSWTNGTGTAVPQYSPGTGLTKVSTNVYKATSTSFNAPMGDTTCNLGVDMGCAGTIKTLTISSSDLNMTGGTSGTQGREVGIANIKFC